MNRKLLYLMAMFCAFILFTFRPAYAHELEDSNRATYVLPPSLVEIDEEAFAGTPVETVILPDGFLSIDANAFSKSMYLTEVLIPESTRYIEDTAFASSPRLKIYGVKGSYAESWAKKHRIPFVDANKWKFILDNRKAAGVKEGDVIAHRVTVNPDKIIRFAPWTDAHMESKRPQDRPELNVIDYRFP